MLRSGDLGDHDGSTDHVGGTPLPAFTVNVELAIVAFTDNVPALIVHGPFCGRRFCKKNQVREKDSAVGALRSAAPVLTYTFTLRQRCATA
jgi:hypothetical protein